jgi:hypothetical protein
MKVVKLKKEKSSESYIDKSAKIQTWGERNDFPQSVDEIIKGSVTGFSCLKVYSSFIFGKGFKDEALYKTICNRKGQTFDDILKLVVKDYAEIGGYALHINYNLNYQISEIQHVPIETVRFCELDNQGNFKTIKTHPDWGKRNTAVKKFDSKDIKEYYFYNPKIVEAEIKEAGGIDKYKGQIYFFSNEGQKIYPQSIFLPALTDMSTEQGLSNVAYRNVRNNFFPAGMMVEVGVKNQDEENDTDTQDNIKAIQGDEQAGKILYVQVESKEEAPSFIPFDSKNYDKEFTVTNETTEARIGKAFSQPPILRSVDVSGNIGAELIRNAYNYYNSITETERIQLERTFNELLRNWKDQLGVTAEILPKTFNVQMNIYEKLNDKQLEILFGLLTGVNEQKFVLIEKLFGITKEELEGIV